MTKYTITIYDPIRGRSGTLYFTKDTEAVQAMERETGRGLTIIKATIIKT